MNMIDIKKTGINVTGTRGASFKKTGSRSAGIKSISMQLWIGMMGLIAIVLLLLWLFQIVFLGNFYTVMRINEIEHKAAAAADLIAPAGIAATTAYADMLDAFAYNNGVSVEVTDSSGVTVYESLSGSTGWQGAGGGMQAQMPMKQGSVRNELAVLLATGQKFRITVTHPRFGSKYILIGSPITGEGGEIRGAMLTGFALASVEDTVSILKVQLLYITIALIAASAVISLILSRSLSAPILGIKTVSEKMAAGDYTARIGRPGGGELGSLAASVNNLGDQLQKIERLRKDLIANVSHELRTPLSIIRGYAETIRDVSGNQPVKRDRQLGVIISETERLGSIVDDILSLSQLQSGYFKLDAGKVSVKAITGDVAEKFALISEKTGIRLDILREGKEDLLVIADKVRIRQVFDNLIGNAFNHTPPGGRITVSVKNNGGEALFEISDTGSGIAEEDLPYIWDRYYKADKSRTLRPDGSVPAAPAGKNADIRTVTEAGAADGSPEGDAPDGMKMNVGTAGAGLGLAIVKGLLEAHGAAFGVRSKYGAGTTFWFILKAAD